MVRFKMLAHHALTGVAVLGIFAAASGIAYQAAGAAVSLGSYAIPR